MRTLTCCQKVALATLMDCEGNISMFYQSVKNAVLYRGQLSVLASNTNLEFLEHFRDMTGIGTFDHRGRPGKTYKLQYAWRLNYPEIPEFLETIYPHLIIKSEQAEIALQWLKRDWETPMSSDDIYIQRDWITKIQYLNRTGP